MIIIPKSLLNWHNSWIYHYKLYRIYTLEYQTLLYGINSIDYFTNRMTGWKKKYSSILSKMINVKLGHWRERKKSTCLTILREEKYIIFSNVQPKLCRPLVR